MMKPSRLCQRNEEEGVFVNERRWAYASDDAKQNPDYQIPVSLQVTARQGQAACGRRVREP